MHCQHTTYSGYEHIDWSTFEVQEACAGEQMAGEGAVHAQRRQRLRGCCRASSPFPLSVRNMLPPQVY